MRRDFAKKACPVIPYETEGKEVAYIATIGRYVSIVPTNSKEIVCTVCKCSDHYAPYMFGRTDPRRVWICGNLNCETMKKENIPTSLPRRD